MEEQQPVRCITGKRIYFNKADAQRDLSAFKFSKSAKDKRPIRWYICQHCGYIHTTSEPKTQYNQSRERGKKFRF